MISFGSFAFFVGFLANIGGARAELAAMWPTVAALLPVLALGGAAGTGVLLLQNGWRWYAPRRQSERFRRLAPQIREEIAAIDPRRDVLKDPPLSESLANRLQTSHALKRLGVELPDSPADLTSLLVLAQQRRLRVARKCHPLPSKK